MDIYIYQGKDIYRFAVLPSSIEIGTAQQNSTVNIINYGEINIIGKRNLRTLSLSSFFPNKNTDYTFVRYTNYAEPLAYVKKFQSWLGNPIHLLVTDTDINMDMTIESFSYSKQDSTGDIYFTLELKEYKKPVLKATTKKKVSKKSTKISRVDTRRITKKVDTMKYTVKKGDTIMSIAKKLTGDASNLYAIVNQNKITNPNKLEVGKELVIEV
jgi:LysM repeat protein